MARLCWQICHHFLPGCLLLEEEKGGHDDNDDDNDDGDDDDNADVNDDVDDEKGCVGIYATIFCLADSGMRQRWTTSDGEK